VRKEIDLFFIKFKVLKCIARAFCGTGGFNFIFLVQKTYCKKNKILIDFFEVDRFRQDGLRTYKYIRLQIFRIDISNSQLRMKIMVYTQKIIVSKVQTELSLKVP